MKIVLSIDASGQCNGMVRERVQRRIRPQRFSGDTATGILVSRDHNISATGHSRINLVFDFQADFDIQADPNSSIQTRLFLSQNRLALDMFGDFGWTSVEGYHFHTNFPCSNAANFGGNWHTVTVAPRAR